jgi:hypothetical protein
VVAATAGNGARRRPRPRAGRARPRRARPPTASSSTGCSPTAAPRSGPGDVAAYAATSIGAQRARDRVAARRAARLPLAGLVLRGHGARIRGNTARLRATISYRFRGVAARFVAQRRLRARRTPGGWRITAVAGRRERPPWEVTAFRPIRAPHVLLLAAAGVPAAALAGALANAYRGMTGRLPAQARAVAAGRGGRGLPRRVLAVAVADSAQARRLTTNIRGVRTLAAIADAAVRESGPARTVASVLSQRLLIVASAWAAMDPASRARVLVHELTHLALARATSGRVPAWLVEGTAMEVSGDDRSAEAAARVASGAAVPLTALCGPDAIARLSGDRQAAAYAVASAATHRIAVARGRAALLRLYTAFGSGRFRGSRAAGSPTGCCGGSWGCGWPRWIPLYPRPDARASRGRDDPPAPRPDVEGRVLEALEVLDERWSGRWPARRSPPRARPRVEALRRRGKYLVWELEDDVHLMLHLRMTGTLLLDPPARPARARALRLLGRPVVWFDDPRRFGTGELALGTPARDDFFAARLGVEPLGPDLTSAICTRWRASAARRSRRSCSTRRRSPAWGTSTPTRRSSARASIRCAWRNGSPARSARAPRRRDRVARGRYRGQGRVDRRLPPSRRRPGLVPGPLPRPPARGEPCPCAAARYASCAPPGGDLRLRELPAAPRARRVSSGRGARSVSRPARSAAASS